MSLERRGQEWRVRWRAGGRQHSRQFARKKDAEAFDLELRRRRQLGPLATSVLLDQTRLVDFYRTEWLPKYAAPNLKESTVRRYAEIWATHLLPRIGGYELREITPALIEDVAAQLHACGLAPATQRKALLLLQGILRRAVVRGLIPANPASVVDKPRTPARRWPEPLAPATIERIRHQLGHRDATLVSLLAYAGLRPGEATTTRWHDLGDRTLHVLASKTERARHVDLLVTERSESMATPPLDEPEEKWPQWLDEGEITVAMAAEAVCCSTRTIRRAIASGELPARLHVGRWAIHEESLRAWVERHRVVPKRRVTA